MTLSMKGADFHFIMQWNNSVCVHIDEWKPQTDPAVIFAPVSGLNTVYTHS